ncbi:ankyrin repeat domain-containing protein [Citrobacter sp. Cf088]|uniref:ankyrin repeat domain-containing protein n=1 Tax=Citrobacter sp. Cf088 TaxID=2985055 RepID=UPI002578DAC2|nr:ankyrin repeat domain-containing protein [Citrobacter sp. Cf088]MDM3222630.1 ankyrin repeat domain-containing protein [Citrobacter sp. Cf088]
MMSVSDKVLKLAFQGEWNTLLPILRDYPDLVNHPSEPKGYTPLHQAAWHGANLSVIGELLTLGADRSATTNAKRHTAYDIVVERHKRSDLQFLLFPQKLTIAQIFRKVVSTERQLFTDYDGNQILVDKMIAACGVEQCPDDLNELDTRLNHLFFALMGKAISTADTIHFEVAEGFTFTVEAEFFRLKFFPLVHQAAAKKISFPEREWAVVSDLFEPAPTQWGLRGSLFLWLEMRQALCQVCIPEDKDELANIISAAFQSLTGKSLINRVGGNDFYVERFSRGGGSSGYVASLFWLNEFIPQLQQRLTWLQTVWSISPRSL